MLGFLTFSEESKENIGKKKKGQIVPCFPGTKGLIAVEKTINSQDSGFC